MSEKLALRKARRNTVNNRCQTQKECSMKSGPITARGFTPEKLLVIV